MKQGNGPAKLFSGSRNLQNWLSLPGTSTSRRRETSFFLPAPTTVIEQQPDVSKPSRAFVGRAPGASETTTTTTTSLLVVAPAKGGLLKMPGVGSPVVDRQALRSRSRSQAPFSSFPLLVQSGQTQKNQPSGRSATRPDLSSSTTLRQRSSRGLSLFTEAVPLADEEDDDDDDESEGGRCEVEAFGRRSPLVNDEDDDDDDDDEDGDRSGSSSSSAVDDDEDAGFDSDGESYVRSSALVTVAPESLPTDPDPAEAAAEAAKLSNLLKDFMLQKQQYEELMESLTDFFSKATEELADLACEAYLLNAEVMTVEDPSLHRRVQRLASGSQKKDWPTANNN